MLRYHGCLRCALLGGSGTCVCNCHDPGGFRNHHLHWLDQNPQHTRYADVYPPPPPHPTSLSFSFGLSIVVCGLLSII